VRAVSFDKATDGYSSDTRDSAMLERVLRLTTSNGYEVSTTLSSSKPPKVDAENAIYKGGFMGRAEPGC
jgi:hypothetical protein